ncbi:MAG: hypothetical protein QGG40_22100, partial [Myxococcota bacterium]|nr:hypothetical protein [Myxococcota bacterium]
MILLLLPLVLARAPGMVQAGAGGFERCPGDEVAAWRSQLQSRSSAAVRQALLDGFEEAVVEWAVCAHLQALPRWSTPEL